MTTTLAWICWGLVALGLIIVVAAVIPLSGRARPLRRALRRLSWRRTELDRLRRRAESLQDQIAALHAQATAEFSATARQASPEVSSASAPQASPEVSSTSAPQASPEVAQRAHAVRDGHP